MTADDRKDYRSLGEILRDAREARDQSIEDVSELTKISPKVLMAIEADDLDRVADPVYAKSFVRTLAETFDLDARWLLTKLEHASAAQKPAPVTADGEERRDDTTWHIEDVRIQKVETPKPRSIPRLAVGVIVGVLLAVAGFWLIQRGSHSSGASNESSASTPPVRQADLAATPMTNPAGEATADPTPQAIEDAEPPTQTDANPPATSKATTSDPAQTTPARPEPNQAQQTPAQPDAAPAPAGKTQATSTDAPSASRAETKSTPEPAPAEKTESPSPPEEEVVVSEERAGLPSIVRQAEEAALPLMKLVVTAVQKVDVVLAADGRGRRMRTLDVGQSWTAEGHDHFSLEISDPASVRVELDGIHRDPPPGLTGEWILYPNPSPR